MKRPLNIQRLRFFLWVGLAYLVLNSMGDFAEGTKALSGRLMNELWAAVFVIALNYFFFEYILPRITRKRPGYSFLLVSGQLFLCVVGLYCWRSIGIQLGIYTSFFASGSSRSHIVANQFSTSLGSFFFFGVIRHIYNHIKLRQTAQQLLIEKQAAELNYLKSQTNPHFLFNTLNNIYSLARDKSDLAPESILRLSKILRFMLYEAGGKYIAVEQELTIMNDYIALEKLRYDDSLQINFNHDIENMQQAVPPLLLIPLVENAFKHGVSETRNRPFVDIHLSVRQRQLTFIVKNSTEDHPEEKSVKENIGLSNLSRQLEILYTDFKLSVQQEKFLFTAILQINLSSHV